MTKVGEGNGIPELPGVQRYRADLDKNTDKFLNALESYQNADGDEKTRLKGVMDDALAMIRSSVDEIRTKGMHKHEGKVEKDYQTYMKHDSDENLSALQDDMSTLKEYNKE